MKGNKYIINKDYAKIIVDSNKYGLKKVKIDIEDVERCKAITWHYEKNIDSEYIVGKYNGKNIRLNRFLLNLNDSNIFADHINRDTLDNRKSNLRKSTPRQNAFNKSIRKDNKTGVAGVEFLSKRNRWRGKIKYNNTTIHLGYFNDFNNAVIARRIAEEYLFGEFSPNECIENIEVNFKGKIVKKIIDKIS